MVHRPASISLMLAVDDAQAATGWYRDALGASVMWDLGSVVGLRIDGAPILLGEPADNDWNTPAALGMPSARVEVFCDDPDAFVERAIDGGADGVEPVQDFQMPWGSHRQGVFADPFGHLWFVGDRSPLANVDA